MKMGKKILAVLMAVSMLSVAFVTSSSIGEAGAKSVTTIGDSVPKGATRELLKLGRVKVAGNWNLGRDGIREIKSLKKYNRLGNVVVIAMGTNHGIYKTEKVNRKYIDQAIKLIGKKKKIVFVTAYNFRYTSKNSYTNRYNKAVKAAAKKNANVKVADWASVISKNSPRKNLTSDGCHLNSAKAKTLYINTIKKAFK